MVTASTNVSWRELSRLPNLLSLVRFPLAALIWVAPGNVTWLVALMVLAGVSDLLDGWLARRAGLSPEGIGAWLDPLCDKAFILSVLIAVWVTRQPPAWMAVVASMRELVLLPLVIARFTVPQLRRAGIPWRALALGKATTVVQFALFGAVLLGLESSWVFLTLFSGLLGLAAGLQYAVRALGVVLHDELPPPRPSH